MYSFFVTTLLYLSASLSSSRDISLYKALYSFDLVVQWQSILASRSEVRGFDGFFFSERKNPEYDLRKGSKAVGPVS